MHEGRNVVVLRSHVGDQRQRGRWADAEVAQGAVVRLPQRVASQQQRHLVGGDPGLIVERDLELAEGAAQRYLHHEGPAAAQLDRHGLQRAGPQRPAPRAAPLQRGRHVRLHLHGLAAGGLGVLRGGAEGSSCTTTRSREGRGGFGSWSWEWGVEGFRFGFVPRTRTELPGGGGGLCWECGLMGFFSEGLGHAQVERHWRTGGDGNEVLIPQIARQHIQIKWMS